MKKKGIACILTYAIIINSVWQGNSLTFAQELSQQNEEDTVEMYNASEAEAFSEQLNSEIEEVDINDEKWTVDNDFSDLTDAEGNAEQTENEELFEDGENVSQWSIQMNTDEKNEIIMDEKSGIFFEKENYLKKTTSDVEEVKAVGWKPGENNKDILILPEKIHYEGKEYIVSSVSRELLADKNIMLPKYVVIPDTIKYIDENTFADFLMENSSGDIYANEDSYAAEYAKKHGLALNTKGISVSLPENNAQIQVGQSIQMQVDLSEDLDCGEQIKWSVAPEEAAVVSEDGKITFLNSGEIKILAEIYGLKGVFNITVLDEETVDDPEFEEVGTNYGKTIANGKCGASSKDTLKWNLYSADNDDIYTLVISGKGQMCCYELTDNKAPWYQYIKSESCKLVLEEGITSIGNYAFYCCGGLEGTLTIPNSVSDIGRSAFEECENLRGTLKIPDGTKSIGESAFAGCKGFTGSLTIPDSVENLGAGAFSSCEGFTGSLIIPDSITEIGSFTFACCTGLSGSLTISDNVKTIGMKAFLNCKGLIGTLELPDGVTNIWREAFSGCSGFSGKIILPDSIVNIDKGVFYNVPVLDYYIKNKDCELGGSCFESHKKNSYTDYEKKRIYGYENSTAQSYAAEYGHEFVMLNQESDIGDCEYDYSNILDSWLSASGTNYSISYLTQGKNFPNTTVTAANDEKFSEQLAETLSNMLFRGLDGWKEIFSRETSEEQAREILVALLDKQSENTKDLSEAESAKKYADVITKTLKYSNWAYAVKFGLNNEEIQELSKICKGNTIADFFIDGKYDSISECLKKTGKVSEQSNVLKCIEEFETSSELADSLTEKVKWMDETWKFVSITDKTIKKIYEIESLVAADEMYSEMLLFLKNNCSFKPVSQAADDLYNVIHTGYTEKLKYALSEIADETEEIVIDEILEKVASSIPYGTLVRNTYKYSVDLMNTIFKLDDIQKQKDNMRCVAYVGIGITKWLNNCRQEYYETEEEETENNKAAKKTVYAYYMLLKTRIAGENSLQKMMEIAKIERKQIYTVSKAVLATLESNKEWLKNTGVLTELSTSVIACPVNVEIYNLSGNLIYTIFDGKETEGYIGDVYYNASYNYLTDDYIKIIRVPVNSGYTFKCVATDLGSIDFRISLISDDGVSIDKEVNNIPIEKGRNVLVSDVSGKETKCVLEAKEQVIKEYTPRTTEEEYVPVASINANRKQLEMECDEKKRIDLTISPENATIQEIEWTSANPEIAKVNSDGVVLAIGNGETVITAKSIQENISAQVKIVVKQRSILSCNIELSKKEFIYNGKEQKPDVIIKYDGKNLEKDVDYAVSYSKNVDAGTAVVQITGKGKYTGNKNINFSIKQASAKLEFKSSKITKKFGSASFTNGFKKKETDGKIYYSSSNTKVASVDKNKGQIKIKGVGKTTITAAANDGTNYKAGKTSFVLTVSKGNNTIQAKNIEKNMSKKAQTVNINASVKDRAKLTYTSNNKSVKVNSKGKITIAAKFTGKAVITIKAAKTARYNSTSKKITVTVKNPNINMEIFKKKSTRKWLEKMCYMRGFRDGATLKKNLGIIVRRDFLYINEEKYKKYKKNLDMLVPKKVVHDYIYDTYGIKVSKVDLPVKDGKYLLKELYWQDATEVRFDKAVKTKSGAKITLKRVLNGKSVGRNEITVKKAKNSRGFVITSIKFYKNPTVQMAKRYIGKSMNDLIMELGDANSFQYGENPDNGEAAGYYYYSKFTVLTTVNYDGSETVTDVLW